MILESLDLRTICLNGKQIETQLLLKVIKLKHLLSVKQCPCICLPYFLSFFLESEQCFSHHDFFFYFSATPN